MQIPEYSGEGYYICYLDDEVIEYGGMPSIVSKVEYPSDPSKSFDEVYKPTHYTSGGRETVDIIDTILGDNAKHYYKGNVIKYLCRAGLKGDAAVDLRKAENYLHRLNTGEWMPSE